MSEHEHLGSFLKDSKKLLRDYVETRLEIYRLRAVRAVSKTVGYLVWVIISLFLIGLLVIFGGITLGFWLSELTASYTAGFGLVTLAYLILILLLAAFRKALFVNPIIRAVLKKTQEAGNAEEEEPRL